MSFRTIAEETAYTEKRDRLAASIERLDEALIGVEWAIGENPEHFPLVAGTRSLRVLKLDGLKSRRRDAVVFIYFAIRDMHTVDFLDIELKEIEPF